ncbi:hypothetical protein [Micromonospora sp. CPCC 206061]|uniref:hypothetical protein n=1 Tax=Micromonospora sp. CPCC 206061 TaxID=3122410 RepID=UPI002FEEF69C
MTTPEASSFGVDLSALLRTMPGLSATAAERADWYERKAALLSRVAAEDTTSNGCEAAELARAARLRAVELREGR